MNPSDRPYGRNWKQNDVAGFVRALSHFESHRIDKVVHGIFCKVDEDEDDVAIPCMASLAGKAWDDEIRSNCERRIPKLKSSSAQDEMRALPANLKPKRTSDSRPAAQ